MDSTQRNAIVSVEGLTIYNTSIKAFQVYSGTAWFSTVHYIGERYGGGIVFYVYDNGQHGLIASTADQSTGVNWYTASVPPHTGTTGDGLNAGAMNTAMIVASQMRDSQTPLCAAKVCADFSVTVADITYGDWYLPSKYELNLLFLQKNVVGGFFLQVIPPTGVPRSLGSGNAWLQDLSSGIQINFFKGNSTSRVRAVRAFSYISLQQSG
ncbi:MAG: hypothetical protein IPK57_09325 [Chitinophagaceae bacterium]|nr:hypothetical protein [Chitinophagaceae bacterium]